MHPSKRITGSASGFLNGKTIVLGLTGSVACVKSFELCRELMRHGAKVQVAMSDGALGFLSETTMEFASGEKVLTKATGAVEHVALLGKDGEADLLLIAPCTANTLGKIAYGFADSIVSLMALTALGSGKPIALVPAMEEAMYLRQPVVRENLLKLKALGIEFLEPRREEDKAKIAETEDIVLAVERLLGPKTLQGKRVLVTGGATKEAIDPVRVLTNRASGKTGREIARQAYRLGATVTLVQDGEINPCIRNVRVESAAEMREAVMRELAEGGCDVFIAAAAVGDFEVERSKEKLKSDAERLLRLKPAPKIVEAVRKGFPGVFVVAFKAETHQAKGALEKLAAELLGRGYDVVAANDVGRNQMGGARNQVVLVQKGRKPLWVEGEKQAIAEKLLERVAEALTGRKGH